VCGRGLKRLALSALTPPLASPAVCGRGLKLQRMECRQVQQSVARRVRAWIETRWRADEMV